MIRTISTLPPQIIQHFNSALLSSPLPGDNLEKLWHIYFYIKQKLMKKANHHPKWKQKAESLEKEFLALYERAKIKKENLSEKTRNKTKEPFYYIEITDKRNADIFDRLRYFRFRALFPFSRNNEIYKN